ncbi:uncharacterized protein BP5553_00653 [Venustampulla echinocandica]|uniref:Myb-like domain-containing protein n=1 Tax=Venustampulla echinocandica TaxID=2656787 RepID=A0A370TYS4_9HELO|nr:uncharacterized protein BP5553_00653 [Venustampulla echinocandica]RDL40674.1 hypothetical protein BP5553_00653 [Venustampulla echinocandica]
MFITARPRFVSNTFETFVPHQKAEPMHQRLVEMSNNEVNAWNTFRPVATPANDNWDQQIDGFGNENFPGHNLNGHYFQDTSSVIRSEVVSLTKGTAYTASCRNEAVSHKRPSVSQQRHQELDPGMNCFEKCSGVVGESYFQWGIGNGRDNFATLPNAQGLDGPSPKTSDGEYTRYITAPSLAHQRASYPDDTTSLNSWDGMGYGYSSYAPNGSIDTQPPVSFNMSTNSGSSAKCAWWPETSHSSGDQYQNIYGLQPNHNGLPDVRSYSDVWHAGTNSSDKWMSQGISPSTISPKLLTLGVSSAALSSAGSSQGTMTDSSAASTAENESESSDSEILDVNQRPTAIRPVRQKLPNTRPDSHKATSTLPNDGLTSAKANKKHPPKGQSGKQKLSLAKRIEPISSSSVVSQTWTESPQSAMMAQATHHREAKDDFLVRSKLAGMSYKEIRRLGKFTEAESTLRGRFRTLTKHKTARVRKPEWNENDIRLLRKAVRKFAQDSDPLRRKIPWKLVAEYIANNGGSYHFGNATCRKRWDELQDQS